MSDLEAGRLLTGRVRRPGGGRKRIADLDPGLRVALLSLVEPDERVDPTPPLRWTTKSTRSLAAELTRQGHQVGADTVAALLRQEGFRLQANAKRLEGSQHADRDAQFRYLNDQARYHRDAGQPVISVDTKKKELVGDFRNPGRSWRPAGDPVPVRVHDVADPMLGTALGGHAARSRVHGDVPMGGEAPAQPGRHGRPAGLRTETPSGVAGELTGRRGPRHPSAYADGLTTGPSAYARGMTALRGRGPRIAPWNVCRAPRSSAV